jgi:lipase ATG15
MIDEILEEFPKSHIWLTGHSLGGALASLAGLSFNLPVVAYESPGDRMAADRLHLPRPPAVPSDKMNIWHFGHTADPIFMGSCNVSDSLI